MMFLQVVLYHRYQLTTQLSHLFLPMQKLKVLYPLMTMRRKKLDNSFLNTSGINGSFNFHPQPEGFYFILFTTLCRRLLFICSMCSQILTPDQILVFIYRTVVHTVFYLMVFCRPFYNLLSFAISSQFLPSINYL